jgi:hypothetical protein
MPELSESAAALLRLHVERDNIRVDDSNREAHREPARAGLMEAVHTFAWGRETRYRFTERGWRFASGLSSPSPSPEESAAPRR